jgi:hypothetical protein
MNQNIKNVFETIIERCDFITYIYINVEDHKFFQNNAAAEILLKPKISIAYNYIC